MRSVSALLLHVCCGPCSIMPIKTLIQADFETIGYFNNPNIQPLAEYLRRVEAAKQCAQQLNIELRLENNWDIAAWLKKQLPDSRSPDRCLWCCASRLKATALKAKELEIPFFSTSLLYSRYQPHEHIKKTGEELAREYGLNFVYQDFREFWQAGIDISKEWEIYRQPYCGCIFSEAERYNKKLKKLEAAT